MESHPNIAPPVVETAERRRTKRQTRPKRQPKYHVILWNDNDHTYEYVIRMLQDLFGHPTTLGFRLADEVDKRGKAIVLTTTLEHAELKRDQIHSFGGDEMVDACRGAMSATIEADN